LANRRVCPRCDLDKTIGSALCRRCRSKLPAHMRSGLEAVGTKDEWTVARAMRAAANYFNVGIGEKRECVSRFLGEVARLFRRIDADCNWANAYIR